MSNNGYIKKFRTQVSKDLKRKHLSAFLILDTVAENAKRSIDVGHSLLEIGEAIITAEECGITSQQFQTGLKFLETNGFIQVIHRGRKDKNSKIQNRLIVQPESTHSSTSLDPRITSRINGTVVKLIDTECYDINIIETPNHIPNQNLGGPRINSYFTPNKQETKELQEEDLSIDKSIKKKNNKKRKNSKIEPISPNPESETAQEAVNQDFSQKEHNIYNQTSPTEQPKAKSRQKKPKVDLKNSPFYPESVRLCEYFLKQKISFDPEFQKPSLEKLYKPIENLLRKGISSQKIEKIIDFCCKDEFWSSISTTKSIEKNFNQLSGKVILEEKKNSSHSNVELKLI